MTSAVLAYGRGYGPDDLRPFVQSFTRTRTDTDIAILAVSFAAPVGDPDYSVEHVSLRGTPVPHRVQTLLGRRPVVRGRRAATVAAHKVARRVPAVRRQLVRWYHPSLSRYLWYSQVCRDLPNDVTHVLLTDSRDVVFQERASALEVHWPSGLFVTAEGDYGDGRTEPLRIGACATNRTWIEKAFGPDVAQRLEDEDVLCSGVAFGRRHDVQVFADRMVELIAELDPRVDAGSDQAVLNVAARTGQLTVGVAPNGSSPVAHLGVVAVPQHDEHGRITTNGGEPAIVVHQYDRHPGLLAAMGEYGS